MEAEADERVAETGARWTRSEAGQTPTLLTEADAMPVDSVPPDMQDEGVRPERRELGRVWRKQNHRRGRGDASWNEYGAMEDGGLAILDEHGEPLHIAPGPVTSGLRYLIARLQQSEFGGVPRRVAFTSALSGEGVSFIANSFAATVAHDLRRRVCVIDVNWWRDDEDDGTNPQARPGILDVLYGGVGLSEALVPTQSLNLRILPAGRAPVSVRSALAHHGDLADLVSELDDNFDHLVFDLPAALVTSDAVALAGLADGFGLVVRQGTATDSQIRSALEEFGSLPSFGVILNEARSSVPRLVRRLLGL